jgi:hypothetical protein
VGLWWTFCYNNASIRFGHAELALNLVLFCLTLTQFAANSRIFGSAKKILNPQAAIDPLMICKYVHTPQQERCVEQQGNAQGTIAKHLGCLENGNSRFMSTSLS